jgi:hypothetical protein
LLAAVGAAPPAAHAVDAVLRAPGQGLDQPTRAFFGTRFGYDFSRVRVHTDANAVSSADAVHARAYTVGHHVVFSRNEYAPESESGRSLLAHELAHVLQQRNTTGSSQPSLEIGQPSDRAEREADALARASLAGAHRLNPDPESRPVLRRTPKDKDAACKDPKNKTWAGCFSTEWYDLRSGKEVGAFVPCGADIKIHFTPNNNVDAEKIAFIQTAQSSEGDQPVSIYITRDPEPDAAKPDLTPDMTPRIKGVSPYRHSQEEKDTDLSRKIDVLDAGGGTAIDNLPKNRSPLAGMKDPDKGNELSGAGEIKDNQFGRHLRDGSKPPLDATMRDYPAFSPHKHAEAQQIFETAALAVEGPQKGAFYGSVQWGWKKGSSDNKPTLLPFRLLKEATPSAIFGAAAKLWNASKATSGDASIRVPMAAEMFTAAKKVELMGSPGKGTSLAKLEMNTRVEVTEKLDDAHKDWRNIVVISGPFAGRVGWVKQESLSDKKVEPQRKSPVRK